MFKSILAKKIIFLSLSTVVVLIALWLIEELIKDRLYYKEEARQTIANSWSGSQQIFGPILVVPYIYTALESYKDETDKKHYYKEVEREGFLHIIPERMKLDSAVAIQERSKGIFSFPVYTAEIKVEGEYDLSPIEELKDSKSLVDMGVPYLAIALSDARGINNKPTLYLQGRKYNFEPGSQLRAGTEGMHALLPDLRNNKVSFNFDLSLRGMGTLWFSPIAKDTVINLDAEWAHPNFVGKFLPNERTIESDKFKANWRISELSGSISENITAFYSVKVPVLASNSFGVKFDTPVDIYRLSIRSVKYGILFVGLTFISFFVFEILKKLQIHPVQYTLVALSLSVFYLLLIAFSEAFGFILAYILATIACVSLLTFYICSILRDFKWGLVFGGFIATLYTLLYVILNSEDHALLLGSCLVFIALGLVMVMTRHLDWYKIGEKTGKKDKSQPNISMNNEKIQPVKNMEKE